MEKMIDQEIMDKLNKLADVIVKSLTTTGSIFINIQIEEEYSQYDVFFSYGFDNLGTHQRGILANDLLIGVVGFGAYGFNTHIHDTDPSYYNEKLKINSYFLSHLFNIVRKKLHEKS